VRKEQRSLLLSPSPLSSQTILIRDSTLIVLLNEDGRDSRKHRDRLEIIAVMLKTARVGVPKTKIMLEVGLSSAQLIAYLSFLVSHGLLETSKNSERLIYRTTAKGKRYLETYREIGDILRKS
jgi:predicted transcriptional regulator